MIFFIRFFAMRLPLVILILISGTFVFGQQKQISGGPLKPEQANVDVRHYTVSLDVSPSTQSYQGFTEIRFNLLAPSSDLIFDLANTFTVSAVLVDGKKLSFSHTDGLVKVKSGQQLTTGAHKIRFQFGGSPVVAVRAPWDGGIQWSTDSLGRTWIAMSCQEDGADVFFPCKDHPSDEPNEGADLIVTVPKGLVVAGPGMLIKQTSSGKKSTFHWQTKYTINTYSILFNVGHYAVVKKTYTTVAGNKLPMEFYVLDYNKEKAAKHLELLERSAHLMEKYFGEYPWVKEKIGIAETPHLGMEHQTMNAYGNHFKYVRMGTVDFDWLLTHEFGHEWWGNKISNIDWAHMWIHEGIDTFSDALFYEEYGGRKAYLDRMKDAATKFNNKLALVQGPVIDSRQTYHGDIYGKGAYFMHTLRFVLGDEVFFPAIKSFATDKRYTYDNFVKTEDVIAHFNAASGKDLKPLFDLYVYSIDKLQVHLKQTGLQTYELSTKNMKMDLPIEIETSSGRSKVQAGSKPVKINSATMPVIDPDAYYLKTITIE